VQDSISGENVCKSLTAPWRPAALRMAPSAQRTAKASFQVTTKYYATIRLEQQLSHVQKLAH